MSNYALSWAWRQDVRNAAAKLTLVALADVADDDGEAWPGIEHLAAKTGVPARTVRRHLRGMAEAGLFTVEERRRPNGSRTSNLYRLALPVLALPAPATEDAELEAARAELEHLEARTSQPATPDTGDGSACKPQPANVAASASGKRPNRQPASGQSLAGPPEPSEDPSTTPPTPPGGNRRTDRAEYELALAEWSARHFPTAPPGLVGYFAVIVRRQREEPTADRLAPLLAEHGHEAARPPAT